MEIFELDLPVYVCRALYDREINTVEELCKKSEGDLMKVRLLGAKGIARIKEQLSIRGLKLLFEYPPTPPRRHRRDKDHRRATDRQTTMRLAVTPRSMD